MKNKPLMLLLLAALQVSAYAQQTFKLNVKKSKIIWDGRKSVGSHHGDVMLSSGTLNYSTAGLPVNGTFVLDMKTIRGLDHPDAEDNEVVTKKLKEKDFFDVSRFPTAVMIVKQITRIGNSSNFQVTGELTMKGVTNTINFMAAINKKDSLVTATAALKIDRIKWNIHHDPKPQSFDILAAITDKIMADEIPITLELVFGL